MITCTFEDGGTGALRHVTLTAFTVNKERTKYLLAQRSGKFSEPFKWGPPGGFLSRDETIVEAVAREAEEESGWKVQVLTLIRVNDFPNRPKEDRQNVDFLYLCEAIEETGNHDSEIDSVKWMSIDELPKPEETAFDHYDNIRLCLAYVKKSFPVPITAKIPSDIVEAIF